MRDHLVAVDIGTASARAGIFDRAGTLVAKETCPIALDRPDAHRAEHDSDDIWSAVSSSVRAALSSSGISPDRIAAIGFDATCSLVFQGAEKIALTDETGFDTISWMDHRALAESVEITARGGAVVERSGGVLSPEMALPKMLWLKRHRTDLWDATIGIFDLADAMTFRASGNPTRSISTLTSKWGYFPRQADGWPPGFLEDIGLGDLRRKAALPAGLATLGTSLGTLTEAAAKDLGLDNGCQVAPGMIDAYAGALGLLGHVPDAEMEAHAALVAGTSTCLIALRRTETTGYRSLWGPFEDVSLPGYWLVEGGQSSAGSLLDHVVRMHAAGGAPDAALHGRIMDRIAACLAETGPDYGLPLHVLPDFHGNRAPLGDPFASGVVSGLTLDTSFDALCRLYWRAAVGLACGLRHILETLPAAGIAPEILHLAGGHAQNPLLVQLYADVTGRAIFLPRHREAILSGTAINAAVAAGFYADLKTAAGAMSGTGSCFRPDAVRGSIHDRDYDRHRLMIRHRAELMAL